MHACRVHQEHYKSIYVNVQYWEIQESMWIVHAFQEDDSNFLPVHLVHVYKGLYIASSIERTEIIFFHNVSDVRFQSSSHISSKYLC